MSLPPRGGTVTLTCSQCGASFDRVLSVGNYPRKRNYCSQPCKRAAAKAQKAAHTFRLPVVYVHHCSWCGKLFTRPTRKRRENNYCTKRCSARATRARPDREASPKLNPVPFVNWLIMVMTQYELTAQHAQVVYGVPENTLPRLLDGKREHITLDVVDRALTKSNTLLHELYDPDTLEPAKGRFYP